MGEVPHPLLSRAKTAVIFGHLLLTEFNSPKPQMDSVIIPVASFPYEMQVYNPRNPRSTSPNCAHFLLPSARPSILPATFAPVKKPLASTDEYITIDADLRKELANNFTSYEFAAREMLNRGNYEMLGRMVSLRLIHDWENLVRFVLRQGKDVSNPEASIKRIRWVFSLAPSYDIFTVAKDYLHVFNSDAELFDAGFPRDSKTKAAIDMALSAV